MIISGFLCQIDMVENCYKYKVNIITYADIFLCGEFCKHINKAVSMDHEFFLAEF